MTPTTSPAPNLTDPEAVMMALHHVRLMLDVARREPEVLDEALNMLTYDSLVRLGRDRATRLWAEYQEHLRVAEGR